MLDSGMHGQLYRQARAYLYGLLARCCPGLVCSLGSCGCVRWPRVCSGRNGASSSGSRRRLRLYGGGQLARSSQDQDAFAHFVSARWPNRGGRGSSSGSRLLPGLQGKGSA